MGGGAGIGGDAHWVRQWLSGVRRGGGELGDLVASFDWSATALGPMRDWPTSLRTAVGVCLMSRFPIVLWWGPELVMIYNDAYRPMLGASKHPRALGSPGKQIWPEIWDVIGPMLHGVLDGRGATWSDDQLLLLDRNGYLEECYFTFSYSPIIDESGRTGGVFCAVTETTHRIVGARRLGTLGALAAQLVDAPSAEDACRRATTVLAANAEDVEFARVYLRRSDGDLVPVEGEADPRWPVEEVARDGAARLVAPPDGAAATSAYVVPVVEPGGERAAAVLVVGLSDRRPFDTDYRAFLDLSASHIGTAIGGARALDTQRRRAQELAELDAAKSAFFSNISHELRTPLTLIMAPLADALDDQELPLPDRQRERLEVVARNAGRLRRLVNGMLDFARIEAGRLVPERVAVDLSRATTDVAVNFAAAMERAGLRFTIEAPPLPRPVHLDREMWDRIVLNLLSNALKYTMDGEVRLELRDAGEHAELRISDTGTGIGADEVPKLFERFHRVRGSHGRSHEGSGIGLALVWELLRLLDGTVSVESVPGEGSTFTVRVPYGGAVSAPVTAPVPVAVPVPAAVPAHDPSETAAPFVEEALHWTADARAASPVITPAAGPAVARPRLLIAEDNRDLREYLRSLLEEQYELELAADGADALAIARRWRPDLLLTDVMMPNVDGFGLLAAIREDPVLRDTPVVLLSARAGEEASAEGFAAGADDYLVKPFSPGDLLMRLRSNLDRAAARSRDAAWRAAIVRSLHEGVFIADGDGMIVEVNEAFTRMTGWGQDEAPYPPPYPWWPAMAEDSTVSPELEGELAQLLGGGTGRYEVRLRHRDGHSFWAQIQATSVDGEHTGDRMYVGSIRDITRRRDLRARRGAAARLAAALAARLDPSELYAATVHGFGEVFGGDVVIARVDRGWPPATVITAKGTVAWKDLPEGFGEELLEACRQGSQPQGEQSGLLVTATPRHRVRDATHLVWTRFPTPRSVSPDEHVLAEMLGEILTAGLDRAMRESDHAATEENLRAAIDSHRFIGQAVGILMERHRLTAAAAFDALRVASQQRNIKLRDIADRVIATGEEPDAIERRWADGRRQPARSASSTLG